MTKLNEETLKEIFNGIANIIITSDSNTVEFEKALEILEELVSMEYIPAIEFMANLYILGFKVEKNPDKANSLYGRRDSLKLSIITKS